MGANFYTLTEAVELFFLDTRPKNFKSALVAARFVWNEILRRTIWAFKSEWVPVYAGDPYPYIVRPDDCEMVLRIKESVTCNGKTTMRSLDEVKNVQVTLPKVKSCGCKEDCGCGALCTHINSYVHTTKEHPLGVEKIWTEVCKNGDVLEWREVPTEKYDADGNSEGIVYEKQHTRICSVEVKPCGCLKDTITNKKLIEDYCGVCAPACAVGVNCDTVFQHGECGKIYLIGGTKILTSYQLQYQERACSTSKVPEYALECLHLGMDYKLKFVNPSIDRTEKNKAKYAYNDGKNKLIEYLNPIDLQYLDDIHHG